MSSRDEVLEYVLDHYHNPRNHGEMPDADFTLQGGHEGCADIIKLYLKMKGDRLEKLTFTGEGCTISQASVSMLTERVQGLTLDDIDALDHQIVVDELGDELVSTRPKCATLGLDTLKVAAKQYRDRLRRDQAPH